MSKRLISYKGALASLQSFSGGFPDRFGTIKGLVDSLFDPRTPSCVLGLSALATHSFYADCLLPDDLRKLHKPRIDLFFARLAHFLLQRGYRTGILTPREMDITGNPKNRFASYSPDVPIGLSCERLSLQEARLARRLEACVDAPGRNLGMEGFVTISLEPLNDLGNTVRPPRLLDKNRMLAAFGTLANASQPTQSELDALFDTYGRPFA